MPRSLWRSAIVTLIGVACSDNGALPPPPPDVYPVDATQLTKLVASNLVGDARRDLIIVARGDRSIRILPGEAGGTFASALAFTAGGDPDQAVAGDVNGDGIADLLVINHLENALDVRLGLGGGQFAAAVTYPLRNHGNRLVVADLNGDAFADVVAAHDGSGAPLYVTAFLGSATGALQQAWEFGTPYFTTEAIGAGDFDGDGKTDVAIALGENRVSVLVFHGLGTGAFADPIALPTVSSDSGISDGTTGLAVGDLNGDGRDDIVVACFGLSNRLVVRLSAGSGFTDPVSIALPSPVAVALGDLDGDGRLDAAAANVEQGTVSLLYGNGNGSFQEPVAVPMGTHPASLAVADFDGNGFADIAVADLNENVIRVRRMGLRGTAVAPRQTRVTP